MKRVFLLVALMLVQGAALHAQAPYYQGKTITFIVGSGAGTAYDIYSRLLANHIGKKAHPGNPP
jgi:tripartite-type tricarboxylate transporter receptor subunit TctC